MSRRTPVVQAPSFGTAARLALEALADPEVKAGAERYFRGAVPFHGVKAPRVREVFRTVFRDIDDQPVETMVEAAFSLLQRPYQEEKQLAVHLLERLRRRWPPDLRARLEPVFDAGVHDWATCDGVSGRVLKVLLERDPGAAAQIARWSRSANPWRQRASAVAFVKLARHGAHSREILDLCDQLATSPDRFVQLGMGWVLRELSLADRDAVLAFLRRHHRTLRREAVCYAIEKLPAPLRQSVLREHAKTPRE